MRGSIFIETFKQTWKQMVYWGLGLASMGLLVVIMVPMFDMQQMRDLLRSLPPMMLAMIGIGKELELFATAEGFVAMGFFGKFALIFAVYPVVMGMRITANDEDEGIMDMVLSLPVQRMWVIIERFAAYTVSIIGVVVMIYIAMTFGVAISGVKLNMTELTNVIIMLVPVLTFVMAFTMLVATIVRRRQVALGIITAFVVASFMIQTLGAMAEDTFAEPIGWVSFFTYYNAGKILGDGLVLAHIAGLLTLSLVLVGLSINRFERRDVGI
jgi:ABC-2 type transport system permease protein